jgi:hypothetical protein
VKSELFFFEKQNMINQKFLNMELKNYENLKSETHQNDSIWLRNEKQTVNLPKKQDNLNKMNFYENVSNVDMGLTPMIISPPVLKYENSLSYLQGRTRKLSLDMRNENNSNVLSVIDKGKIYLDDSKKLIKNLKENKFISLNSKNKQSMSYCGEFEKSENIEKKSMYASFGVRNFIKKNKGVQIKSSDKKMKPLNIQIRSLKDFELKNHMNSSQMQISTKSRFLEDQNHNFQNLSLSDHQNKIKVKNRKIRKSYLVKPSRFKMDFIKKNEKDLQNKMECNRKKAADEGNIGIFKNQNLNNQIGKNIKHQTQRTKTIYKKKNIKKRKYHQKQNDLNESRQQIKNLLKSEKSFKTISSKDTLIDLESDIRPSILTYFNLMIIFCEDLVNYMKQHSLKMMSCSELPKLFFSFISKLKSNRMQMYQSIFDDQLNVLKSLGKKFTISDFLFIKKFFILSQSISTNYDSFDNYFIDTQTQSVYLRSSSVNEQDTNLSNSSYSDSKINNLVSFKEFISVNSELINKLPINKNEIVNLYSPKSISNSNSRQIFSFDSAESKNNAMCCKDQKKIRSNKKSKAIKKRIYKKASSKGCKCSKSKCLRLHCVCFRAGNFCGESCNCKGCYNTKDNKQLVENVINVTKDINSHAFKSRILEIEINGQVTKLTTGCSCSKNNCLKNYCECRKNGLGCSPLCKCENCKNSKIDLDPSIASTLYTKASRKKKKIIFKNSPKDQLEVCEQILTKRFVK